MGGHSRLWLLSLIAACAGCGSASTAGDVRDAAPTADDAGSGDGDGNGNGNGTVGTDAASGGDGPTTEGDGSRDAGGPSPEAGDAGGPNFDENGPVPFNTTTATVQNGADTFTENIYLPSSPGAHPVVSLTPGLQQPTAAYAPYAERLASYGIVVLVRDDPGLLVQSQVIAADLTYVVGTWLAAQNGDASSPLHGALDLTRVGLTGHSRGGQASLLAAEALVGHVVAWFGIDPDDPGTIDGFTESTELAATHLGSIGIPTTFLGGQVATFCTPANINYQVLYAAAPSPSVLITAVDASHTEFEVQSACVDCSVCVPMGTANQQVVLAYAVRYLTAFFARELLGIASVGATFQGAGGPGDVAAGLVQITSK
jgi:hypothetical protein